MRQRQDRMTGTAGQKSPSCLLPKKTLCQKIRRPDCPQPEAQKRNRVLGPTQRAQSIPQQPFAVGEQGLQQGTITRAIPAEFLNRPVQRTPQDPRRLPIERVCDRSPRSDPFQTMLLEWELLKIGGKNAHGVRRRADIMAESGKGQFARIRATTQSRRAFENQNRSAIARQGHPRREPIGSGSNNYRIELLVRLVHSFKVWHNKAELSLPAWRSASRGSS